MTLTSTTKIQRKPAYDRKTGKRYEYQVISIPRVISEDSQYPFRVGDRIRIAVDPKSSRIIIEKIEPKAARRRRMRRR